MSCYSNALSTITKAPPLYRARCIPPACPLSFIPPDVNNCSRSTISAPKLWTATAAQNHSGPTRLQMPHCLLRAFKIDHFHVIRFPKLRTFFCILHNLTLLHACPRHDLMFIFCWPKQVEREGELSGADLISLSEC